MRRLIASLYLISVLLSAAFSATAESEKTLNAKLDLTSKNDASFYFASADDHSSALSEMALESDTSKLPVLMAVGQFDIVWDVTSSEKFAIYVYSSALESSSGTSLDWNGRRISDKSLLVGKENGYGGSESNIVYSHDPSESIGNSGSIGVSIETEDLSGKPFIAYSTTLKLELKTV